jgi:hypothetical protein
MTIKPKFPRFMMAILGALRPRELVEHFKIVIARPLRTQAGMPVLKGSSEVFRIVDDHTGSNHETLPRNRFLLHRGPFRLQWAVTPKLTMIAGRQLSIGEASGAKLPSNPTISCRNAVSSVPKSECGKKRLQIGLKKYFPGL